MVGFAINVEAIMEFETLLYDVDAPVATVTLAGFYRDIGFTSSVGMYRRDYAMQSGRP